jgi:hemoglobin-like flavoprotein
MTAQQRSLVRDTFPAVQNISGPLSQLFYGRLFQLAPPVRAFFRGDIRAQGRKLMDMIGVLVESLDDFERNRPILRALGQRHVAYGVQPEHYNTLTAAFIWALGQALESEFTPDVKAAWVALIDEVNSTMKAGASELSTQSNMSHP